MQVKSKRDLSATQNLKVKPSSWFIFVARTTIFVGKPPVCVSEAPIVVGENNRFASINTVVVHKTAFSLVELRLSKTTGFVSKTISFDGKTTFLVGKTTFFSSLVGGFFRIPYKVLVRRSCHILQEVLAS